MVRGNFMVTPSTLNRSLVHPSSFMAKYGVNKVSGIITGKGLTNICVLPVSNNYMPGKRIGFFNTPDYIFCLCYRSDFKEKILITI